MAFNSLRQRLIFVLLLPVAALLTGLGVAGFFFARDALLAQWRESALLSLERAAHAVDMRLAQPAQAVELAGRFSADDGLPPQQWEQELTKVPGVTRASLSWPGQTAEPQPQSFMSRGMGRGMGSGQGMGSGRGMGMRFMRARISQVTSPRYDTSAGQDTVTVIFELSDEQGKVTGRLNLTMSFNYLLAGLKGLSWWHTSAGYLVDETGLVLASTPGADKSLKRIGEGGGALGVDTLQSMLTKRSGTEMGPGHPAEQVAGFYRLHRAPWTLVLVAPGRKVLAPVLDVLRTYALVAVGCVALVLILVQVVTGKVAGSVRRVCQAARQVAQGDYQQVPVPRSNDEFHRLAESFNTMVDGLRQKEFLRQAFGRYVDKEVAERLMSRPEATRMGGERRRVAIMMSDIRGFTPLAASLSPEQTVSLINAYLERLIEVIKAHHGIIVDFLGDAVLVFFDSLEVDYRTAVHQAACCALNMCQASQAFNQEAQAQGLPFLGTGIGLNAGEVVVGNIGSTTRTKYGIIGGPVNLTHRIQAQADGGEIVASEEVVGVLGDDLQVSGPVSADLKGVEQPVPLFTVIGVSGCGEVAPGVPLAPCERQV